VAFRGHTHTAYVMETLIDELATSARVDPFEFRRRLLSPDAHKLRAALDLLDRHTAGRNQLSAGTPPGSRCTSARGGDRARQNHREAL
jgi:isoquinoline 1-oxidoreductase beta subunit